MAIEKQLFAYGTLMCPEIMYSVSGHQDTGIPAVLYDFARYRVINENYPAIVAEAGQQVDGLLYRDISKAAWQKLDSFEGEMYTRKPVTVIDENNNAVIAETYIIHPGYVQQLNKEPWSLEQFTRQHKSGFIREYNSFFQQQGD